LISHEPVFVLFVDFKHDIILKITTKIWYHRRALLEENSNNLQDFVDTELEYIDGVLQEDCKNYHAWTYRQWIISTIDSTELWEKEIAYGT
jgi:protein farnesyltransferase/geranylgeranyltransferase type-1 subunit alpha